VDAMLYRGGSLPYSTSMYRSHPTSVPLALSSSVSPVSTTPCALVLGVDSLKFHSFFSLLRLCDSVLLTSTLAPLSLFILLEKHHPSQRVLLWCERIDGRPRRQP
jgi:hypothetical protein